MNKFLSFICAISFLGIATACSPNRANFNRSYNYGINIIPTPAFLEGKKGYFTLSSNSTFYVPNTAVQPIASFFSEKLKRSTGMEINLVDKQQDGSVALFLDSSLPIEKEGYELIVAPHGVEIKASTEEGIFYGMQSFMQLLPAEVESATEVDDIEWIAPCVEIKDAPRFSYRGVHLDPCRHFITVENIKKQLDVMALFKINTMHWHLTEDQAWRIEIKKYPKLTEVGAVRIEGEGYEYGGFYTQEEVREIVAYAAERYIDVIPELELPGHELAAIAAYPELSCAGEATTPRIIWGVEDIVMCPGKENTFEFLENVIEEMVSLFPSQYFHIGGDECPKNSWKNCDRCQSLIRREGLLGNKIHTAEERLQSYVIGRIEKVLAKHGKRIIGWDEILEGGLSPGATVMSWRGESGGIASALQNHDVVMTPSRNGMYLDKFQGDPKIEPVSHGGYTLLSKVYDYNPVPDTLVALGKSHFIKGVQVNNWSEYMYTNELMEYRMYPRLLALSEIAWTPLERKDYADFERRINNAYVRLDGHHINYHIPQPEQPNGSCNFVAFVDSTILEFKTTRPIKMIYTLDGSEPIPTSQEYVAPFIFYKDEILKIRSVLPSGKMSPVRRIVIEKQNLSPSVNPKELTPGLKMKMTYGTFFKASELPSESANWKFLKVFSLNEISKQEPLTEGMRGVKTYGAIATGYFNIPEDGVYYFSSNNDEVWIDGRLLITNEGETKRFSRHDSSMALAKGLHSIKIIFLGHIIGGWPSMWDDASVKIRKSDAKEFIPLSSTDLFN